jgi:[CysO sulfur-carrier protein]-S-L-cysteine hydrolase
VPVTRLAFPRPLADELIRQAFRSPRVEVCGLISGDANGFKRCFPVANVAANPERRFEMDPRGQIDALRAMAQLGEELRAIYHSHPNGPAHPSDTDVDQHQYPDSYYLIISLARPVRPELRAFLIRDGSFNEVSLDFS